MAVPKKRTGHSAQGSRRANWKATKPETTKCPNCGATVLAHTVCTACGTYKGQPVKLADKAAAATAEVEEKPAKKPAAKKTSEKADEKTTKTSTAKKATKKSAATKEQAEETKAEETKAEEAKTEE